MKDLIRQALAGVKKTQLWRSVFRHGYEDTPRNRVLQIFSNVFLHLHPFKMRLHALKFSYTWGMGGISFFLFLILTLTGVLLMFYYVPDVNRAYSDMKDLKYVVPFGVLLRNLHRWAAHAMVITVWAHMLSVFLRGAYKAPREFNWCVGVILLVFTLLLSFSGYLLPWDQLAFWAVTVGTNMAKATPFLGSDGPFSMVTDANDVRFALLGGKLVGQNALIRFYVWHCIGFPLAAAAFMAVHFWRIRKDGFSGPPVPEGETREDTHTWPALIKIEFIAAITVTAVLVLWSLLANAPLEEHANPTRTPNPAKAPWYFLGLQELLVYFDPWIAGVTLPGMIIVGLMLVPYLDKNPAGTGSYGFRPRRFAMSTFVFGYSLWAVLITIGVYCRGPGWVWYWPWESWDFHKPVFEKTWSLAPAVGLLAAGAYLLAGFFLPLVIKPGFRRQLGWVRYFLVQGFILAMFAVPVKILLRLLFNLKYILQTPWFNI